jgi:hypothetical protein
VCPNARTLQRDVLTPDAVARVITAALDTVRERPDAHAQDRATVQAELDRVTAELQRLTDALATGQAFTSVQDAIAARESRRTALQAPLAHLDGLQQIATLDPETLAASVQARLIGRVCSNATPRKRGKSCGSSWSAGSSSRPRRTRPASGTSSRGRPPTASCWRGWPGQMNGAPEGELPALTTVPIRGRVALRAA